MIQSFRDKATHNVFARLYVKGLSPELQRTVYRKLILLDAAETLDDLRVPPGNRVEKLSRQAGPIQHPCQRSVQDLFWLAGRERL